MLIDCDLYWGRVDSGQWSTVSIGDITKVNKSKAASKQMNITAADQHCSISETLANILTTVASPQHRTKPLENSRMRRHVLSECAREALTHSLASLVWAKQRNVGVYKTIKTDRCGLVLVSRSVLYSNAIPAKVNRFWLHSGTFSRSG